MKSGCPEAGVPPKKPDDVHRCACCAPASRASASRACTPVAIALFYAAYYAVVSSRLSLLHVFAEMATEMSTNQQAFDRFLATIDGDDKALKISKLLAEDPDLEKQVFSIMKTKQPARKVRDSFKALKTYIAKSEFKGKWPSYATNWAFYSEIRDAFVGKDGQKIPEYVTKSNVKILESPGEQRRAKLAHEWSDEFAEFFEDNIEPLMNEKAPLVPAKKRKCE